MKNSILITNIGHLCCIHPRDKQRLRGNEMGRMGSIDNAWLLIEGEDIASFGAQESLNDHIQADIVVDAKGGTLLPCWCDPHTHMVYATSREGEFVDKIRGLSYAEIARRGGGILNSADRLHAMSEDELYNEAMKRLQWMVGHGTGCVEIKSGYGLNTEDELKTLRVIKRMKETSRVKIMSTFLGAHAVGRAYKGRQEEYVDLVVNEMLPAVAEEQLAEYVDVFCDEGFFTPAQTHRILQSAARYGMRPKIHASELSATGGVAVALENGALSVDHLENASDEELQMLLYSDTMPTLLPGTSFFLNMPYALGRKMTDMGMGVALATDFNPGSTPSADMKFVVSLACIKMKLTPTEAINAATLNSAYAMGLGENYGSIAVGKKASLQLLKPIPSTDYIPYAYTRNLVRTMVLRGEIMEIGD